MRFTIHGFKKRRKFCTFSQDGLLKKSITSVQNQDFPADEFEILVVDKNSTGITLEEISRTTDWNMAASDKKNNPLNMWQTFLSDSEKKDIAGIVRSFGISCYDTEDIMPLGKC